MGELINGRTPDQVKRILRWLSFLCADVDCEKCQYNDICTTHSKTDIERDALALIESLEAERDAALAKVPRWISVEDEKPEPFVSVQVYMPGETPHPTVREGFITKDGVWHAGLFDREPDEVTHWKPMSEPPEVEV